jgi:hypothetical protein
MTRPRFWRAVASEYEAETVQGRSHRISWAWLLERVLDIDMQQCSSCGGGGPKIIAAILADEDSSRSGNLDGPSSDSFLRWCSKRRHLTGIAVPHGVCP